MKILTHKDSNSHWQPSTTTDLKCLISSEPLNLSIHANNLGKTICHLFMVIRYDPFGRSEAL